MKLGEILTGPETWCQGTFGMFSTRRHCLVGGVMRLRGDAYDGPAELRRLRSAICDATGEPFADVMTWNDTPGRTWEDVAPVVEAYDRARLLESWRTT